MLNIRTLILWIVICWFALLQAVSPFLHAHIGPDSNQQSLALGIHMHGFNTDLHHDQFQQTIIQHREAHIITVDQGTLEEDFKFIPPLLAVLVTLVFSFTLVRTYARVYAIPLVSPLPYRHNTHPRAPPHP